MDSVSGRYAVIAYVANAMEGKGTLGKKALQKLIHLTTDLKGLDIGYKFRLYTYGPFSRELAADIDILDSMGILNVEFDELRNGYNIKPGTKNKEFLVKNKIEQKLSSEIDAVIGKFGDRLAKNLELSSMTLFILKNGMVEDLGNDQEVISKFLEIKPHFDIADVSKGLDEIRNLLH